MDTAIQSAQNTGKIMNAPAFMRAWDRPDFKFDLDQSGTENYVFGGRAGPSRELSNVAHEMAHVIQFTPSERRSRFKNGNLTFMRPKHWCYNRYVCEPETDQITQRELETMAIQFRIMDFTDLAEYSKNCLSIIGFLPDDYNFHPGVLNDNGEALTKVAETLEKYLEKWPIKKIKSVWRQLKLKD